MNFFDLNEFREAELRYLMLHVEKWNKRRPKVKAVKKSRVVEAQQGKPGENPSKSSE